MSTAISYQPVLVAAQTLQPWFDAVHAQLHLPVGTTIGTVAVTHVAPLDLAQAGAFAFLSNPRLREQLLDCRASVVALTPADYDWLQTQNVPSELHQNTVFAVCAQPYALFAMVAQSLYLATPSTQTDIHPTAVISPTAQLGQYLRIGARVVVADHAVIGDGAVLDAGASVGEGVSIGAHTHLYPNATVYHGCVVGERCIIHAGAVIGADGFGFAPTPNGWAKIPQVGRVVIGNDVEIGANTTIDRGALSDTVIHNDVKIDNLVQIAHNCVIGAHTAVAGCAAMAGSTIVGESCMIGGAAMLGGHLTIADHTVVSGGTAITHDITAAGQYTGLYPSSPHREWERNASALRQLSELRKRLRQLERSVHHAEPINSTESN